MKLSTLMLSAVVALGSIASADVMAQTKELKATRYMSRVPRKLPR